MILISSPVNFTLQKAETAQGRERIVQISAPLNLYEVTDVARVLPFRVLESSRMLVKKAWPVFVGAKGLRPYGNLVSTPASMAIRLEHSKTVILINDWERGAENLNIGIEYIDVADPYHSIKLDIFAFQYDGLNMQDIYNGTNARAYMCLDVEAVPYNV